MGPGGTRRSVSHCARALAATPSSFANSRCENPSVSRTARSRAERFLSSIAEVLLRTIALESLDARTNALMELLLHELGRQLGGERGSIHPVLIDPLTGE